jgi:hypothetical protein
MRTLEVRLREYADAQRATAAQMVATADAIQARYRDANMDPLREDGARLLAIIADDVDKLLRGEELPRFTIEGTVG